MTLIAIAIATAYGYRSLVVFGLPGKIFFWKGNVSELDCLAPLPFTQVSFPC